MINNNSSVQTFLSSKSILMSTMATMSSRVYRAMITCRIHFLQVVRHDMLYVWSLSRLPDQMIFFPKNETGTFFEKSLRSADNEKSLCAQAKHNVYISHKNEFGYLIFLFQFKNMISTGTFIFNLFRLYKRKLFSNFSKICSIKLIE